MTKTNFTYGYMNYRKLGNTGLDVSTIGFGTWQLGGMRWRKIPDAECINILRQSQHLGVNIFDAATVYGNHETLDGNFSSRSQEILGQAFEHNREEVIYCVKVGQFNEYSHRADFDPDRLVSQVRESMCRLRTNYSDICLIHAPPLEEVRSQRAISVLKALRALGIVRNVGYSFECEPKRLQAALEQQVDVIMLQHNLIDSDCQVLFDKAEAKRVGIPAG